MRLISTLWATVRWKKMLVWYIMAISFFIAVAIAKTSNIYTCIFPIVSISVLFLILLLTIWNRVIRGHPEGLPIFLIWNHVVPDIKVLEGDIRLTEMKKWCKHNCEGKWVYCMNGYFSFKNKYDAMGFKLRWI